MFFDKTALHIAVEKENIDIVKLLLQNSEIDINATFIWPFSFYTILIFYLFMMFNK